MRPHDSIRVKCRLVKGQAAIELKRGFETLRSEFRGKFGRDPGPNDPVFFDPDQPINRSLSHRKA